jgi:hypothetical protein
LLLRKAASVGNRQDCCCSAASMPAVSSLGASVFKTYPTAPISTAALVMSSSLRLA